MDEIGDLRQQIDSIDDELLRLFNERARLVVQIGHIKKSHGLPIYIPSREAQILIRVQRDNPGPLSPEAVARLYQQLMEEAKKLEDANVGFRAQSDAPDPTL
jgi:chorismate mutase